MNFKEGQNSDVRGDDKALRERGTGTGMNGDTYGADLSPDATNRQGAIARTNRMDGESASSAEGR